MVHSVVFVPGNVGSRFRKIHFHHILGLVVYVDVSILIHTHFPTVSDGRGPGSFRIYHNGFRTGRSRKVSIGLEIVIDSPTTTATAPGHTILAISATIAIIIFNLFNFVVLNHISILQHISVCSGSGIYELITERMIMLLVIYNQIFRIVTLAVAVVAKRPVCREIPGYSTIAENRRS
jgi:hypothetical protein